MNWLDIALCVLIVVFAVQGAVRGFTRQIVGLAAALIGLLLGCWLYDSVGAFLVPYVSHKGVSNFIGFVLVFVGVQVVGGAIGWAIFRFLKTVGLTFIDRILGVAFGMLKGALIGLILIVAVSSFTFKPFPAGVSGSRLAPIFMEAGRLVSAMTPKEMREGFDRTYQNLKRYWENELKPDFDRKLKEKESLPGASV